MKKIMGFALVLVSLGTGGFASDAKGSELGSNSVTLAANASPQWQRGRDRRYNRTRVRAITRQRTVRYGRRVYRETYVVRYLPNGRTSTQVISRVRIA